MCLRIKLAGFSILLTVLFFANLAFAQFAQRGAINGVVTDSSGAVLPGTPVTLTDVDHNQTRVEVADATGHFEFTGLIAGQYVLSTQKAGFEPVNTNPIQVAIGSTIRFDLKLSVGSVKESVVVTSNSPLLTTEHANVGVEITQQQMQELPMNGLNFTSLAALAPAVSTEVQKNINPGGSYAVGSQFSSGGVVFTSGGLVQGSRDNGFYINGVNINDNYESSISYEPASEAIQNANLQVADFSAANGHDISTFSIQTKGGTRKFHGSVYEYLENDFLNATNSFDKAEAFIGQYTATKPTLRRNQFGGGAGGPVIIPKVPALKNKLFFFANYENFIEHDGSVPVQGSVPSVAERTGDFSELLSGSTPYQLYNPYTTTYDSSGYSTRLPIAGNRVDLALKPDNTPVIDPLSAPILALYPKPNIPNTPSYLQNIVAMQLEAFANYHFDSRFDLQLSSHDNAFVTYSKQHGTNNNAGGILPDFVYDNDDASWLITVNEVHIFTPHLTNEFIFGKSYAALTIVSPSEIAFLHSAANPIRDIFKNTGTGPSQGVYGIDIDNYVSPGFDQDFLASNHALQFSDNVSWIRGRHTMTFGLNFFRKGEHDWDFGRYVSFGGFSRGGFDQNYDGGDAMADVIMGVPRHIHQLDTITGADATAPDLNVMFPYWGAYANDKFQITPKLTLSLGLRYDLNMPVYDPYELCCAVYQPTTDGGIVEIPGVAPGLPQHYLSAGKTNFAPRLSLAYSPNSRTVIRAGYGIFFDAGASQISTVTGFANGASPGAGSDLTSTILGYPADTPTLDLAEVFQPQPVIPKGQYPVSTGTGQGYFGDGQLATIYYQDQKSVPLPYYQRFIFDFQHSLSNQSSFTLGYIGAQGRKGANLANINLPPYQTGWALAGLDFDAARPNNAGRFGDIYVQRPNLNSFYNALVAKFEHRFAHGYQLMSNYTWGKTVSDYPWINNLSYNGAPGGGSGGFQYPNVRNRGESSGSHRQRFVLSGIWSPVYGNKWPVWAKIGLTGWRITGIETLESGDILTAQNYSTSAEDFAGPDELNVNGNPNLPHGSKNFLNQFNTAAFSVPNEGTRGDSGLGTIQGPGQNNCDLSVA